MASGSRRRGVTYGRHYDAILILRHCCGGVQIEVRARCRSPTGQRGGVVEETVKGDGETQATEAGMTGGRGQLELLGEPLPRLLTRHMSERVKCFRHV